MSNIEKKYVDYNGLSSYDSEIKDWVDDEISTSKTDFEGATSAAAGAAGQVPAPSAGDNEKFLRGDGTWASTNSDVTGVKGDSESSYRTGNVNLTLDNLGIFVNTSVVWGNKTTAEKAAYKLVIFTDQ